MKANKIALDGRWHGSADTCSMTSQPSGCDPWFRVDLKWADGGHIYSIFDNREDAVAYARRLGFA